MSRHVLLSFSCVSHRSSPACTTSVFRGRRSTLSHFHTHVTPTRAPYVATHSRAQRSTVLAFGTNSTRDSHAKQDPTHEEGQTKAAASGGSKAGVDADGNAHEGSIAERVKVMFKTYGKLAIVIHCSLYATVFTGCYAAVLFGFDCSNLLAGYDDFFLKWGVDVTNPVWANLAFAWVLTQMTGPARGVFLLVATPMIARRWPFLVAKAVKK